MFSKLPELIQKSETVSYIGKIENVESEWGLYDEMKVSSYKVVVVNDIVTKS